MRAKFCAVYKVDTHKKLQNIKFNKCYFVKNYLRRWLQTVKRRHFSVLFTEKVEKKVASLDSVVEHFVYLAVIICKREKKKKKEKIFGLGQTRYFLNPQRTYVIKFKRAHLVC